jgi:hypothetical protein
MASPRDPELDVAAAAMVTAGARFAVIGGFAVIANRFVHATDDVEFLVPDDPANDHRVLAALNALNAVRQRDDAPLQDEHLIGQEHLRVISDAGLIDIVRGGVPPLDFETVASGALRADYDGLSSRSRACAASSASSALRVGRRIDRISNVSPKSTAHCRRIRFPASIPDRTGELAGSADRNLVGLLGVEDWRQGDVDEDRDDVGEGLGAFAVDVVVEQ